LAAHPDTAAGSASRQANPGPPPASALLDCVTETLTGRTGMLAELALQRARGLRQASAALGSGRRDPGKPVHTDRLFKFPLIRASAVLD
jgi:hypothetical protein